MHKAFIAIGSNIGNRLKNCQNAIKELKMTENIKVCAISKIYETEALEYKNQPHFINLAVKIKTKFNPISLLHILKKIEQKLGRKKNKIRYGPRIIDLDIIFFDEIIMKSNELEIPHPKMHKRLFVLKPICDIDADFFHPKIKKSVLKILQDFKKK